MRTSGIMQGFKTSVLALIVAALLAVGLVVVTETGEKAYAADATDGKTITAIEVTHLSKLNYISGDGYIPGDTKVDVTWEDENGVVTTDNISYESFPSWGLELSYSDGQDLTDADNGQYVVVTIDGYDFTDSFSEPLSVAAKDSYTDIELVSQPETDYIEGDTFSTSGMQVELTYANGATKVVYSSELASYGVVVSPSDGATLSAGDTSYTVSNASQSVFDAGSLNVVVKTSVEFLEIKTDPTALSCVAGQDLDPAGLVVTVGYLLTSTSPVYLDVAYEDFADYGLDFTYDNTTGEFTVSSDNGVLHDSGSVTLIAVDEFTQVAVESKPENTNYVEGQAFDPTGLVVELTYENGEIIKVAVTDFAEYGLAITPSVGDVLTLDDQIFTVYSIQSPASYSSLTPATYSIQSYAADSSQLQNVQVTGTLNVIAKTAFESIEITAYPETSIYVVGQDFDPTGLVVTVWYFLDSDSPVSFDVAYDDFADYGLVLTYDSATGDFSVGNDTGVLLDSEVDSLISLEESTDIVSIEAPENTNYVEGQAFDPTGLVVELTYENGYVVQVAAADFAEYGIVLSPASGDILSAEVLSYTLTIGDITISGALSVDEQPSLEDESELPTTGDSSMAVVAFIALLVASLSAATSLFVFQKD